MAPDIDLTKILDVEAVEKLETSQIDELYAQLQSTDKCDFKTYLDKLVLSGNIVIENADEKEVHENSKQVYEAAARFYVFMRAVLQMHESQRVTALETDNAQLRQDNQQLKDAAVKRTGRAGDRRARERSSSPFYKDEIARLEKQINMQDNEIKNRDRQVAQLKADNAELEAKSARVSRENQALQAEIDDLNSDIRHLHRRLDNSTADIPTTSSTSKRRRAAPMRRAFSTSTSMSNSVLADSHNVRAATTAILEQKIDNQDRQLVRTLGDARMLAEQNETMQVQIQELQNELDEALQYLQEANDEIETQQARLHEMENNFRSATQAQILAVQAQIGHHRHEKQNIAYGDDAEGAATVKDAANTVVKALSNKADSLTRIVVEQKQQNDDLDDVAAAAAERRKSSDADDNNLVPSMQQKRQAYEKLLKQLQTDINNHEFNIESAAVTYLRQLLNDKDEQISALHGELMSASNELQNAVMFIEAMKTSVQPRKHSVAEPTESPVAKDTIAVLEKRLERAQLQLASLEQQLREAYEQLAVFEEAAGFDDADVLQLARLQREIKSKNRQLSVLLKRLSETEAELQVVQDENDRLSEMAANSEAVTAVKSSAVQQQRRRRKQRHVSFGRNQSPPAKNNARSTSADDRRPRDITHVNNDDDVSTDENSNNRAARLRRSRSTTQLDRRPNNNNNNNNNVVDRFQLTAAVRTDDVNGGEQDKLQTALHFEIAQLERERVQLQNIIRKFAHASRAQNNSSSTDVDTVGQPSSANRLRAPLRQFMSNKTAAFHAGGDAPSTSVSDTASSTATDAVEHERRRNRQLLSANHKLEECLQDTLEALRLFNTTNANNNSCSSTQLRMPGYVRTTFTGIIDTLNEQLLACLNDMLAQRQALVGFRKNIGDLQQRLGAQIAERQVLLKRCVSAEADAAEARREARRAKRASDAEWQAKQTLQEEYARLVDTLDQRNIDEVQRRMAETERRLVVTLDEQRSERIALQEAREQVTALHAQNRALAANIAAIESQIVPLIQQLTGQAMKTGLSTTPLPNFDAVDDGNGRAMFTSDDAESSSGGGTYTDTTISRNPHTRNSVAAALDALVSADGTSIDNKQLVLQMLVSHNLQPPQYSGSELGEQRANRPAAMLEDGEVIVHPSGSQGVPIKFAAAGERRASTAEPGEADSGIAASSITTNTTLTDGLRATNKANMNTIDRLKRQLSNRDDVIQHLRQENQQLQNERVQKYGTFADTAVQTDRYQLMRSGVEIVSVLPDNSRSNETESANNNLLTAPRRRSSSTAAAHGDSIEKRMSALLNKSKVADAATLTTDSKLRRNSATATEKAHEAHAFTQTGGISEVPPPPASVLDAFNAQLALKQQQIREQCEIIASLNSALESAKAVHLAELRQFEQRAAARDAERQNELGALKLHVLRQQHDDSVADAEISDLEARLAQQNVILNAKIADLERPADSYRRDSERLRNLVDEMRNNISTQERQIEHLKMELEQAQRAVVRERDDSERFRRENAEFDEQIKRIRLDSAAQPLSLNDDIGMQEKLRQQIETRDAELLEKTRIIQNLKNVVITGLKRRLADAEAKLADEKTQSDNDENSNSQLKRLRKNRSSPNITDVTADDEQRDEVLHAHKSDRKQRPVSAATTSAAAVARDGGGDSSMRYAVEYSSTLTLRRTKSPVSADVAGDRLRLQALYKQTQKSDATINKLQQENDVLKRKLAHAEGEVKKFKTLMELDTAPNSANAALVVHTTTTTMMSSREYVVGEDERRSEVNTSAEKQSAVVAAGDGGVQQERIRELEHRLRQREALCEQLEKKCAELVRHEQVIRWDESKKWQLQSEKLRAKAHKVQQQLDDAERREKMLRSTLDRATSERGALAAELERVQKRAAVVQSPVSITPNPSSHQTPLNSTQKINQLAGEIRRLKRQLAEQEAKSSEHVKNLLATRKLEDELKNLNAVLQKENCSLASLVDKTRQEIEALRMRCEQLQRNESDEKSAATAVGQSTSGNAGSPVQDAATLRQRNAELERAIGLLKPVVESLQRERNQLRDQLKALRERLKQLETVRTENDTMQTELSRLRAAELNPEYQHSLKRVLGENDTLIEELRHEKARADRLQSRVAGLDSQRKLLVQRNNELSERLRMHAVSGNKEASTKSTTPRLSMAYQALEKKIEDLEEEVEKWKFKANMHEQQSAIRKSLAGYTDADVEEESRRVRTYEDVLNQNIRLRTQSQLLQQESQDKDRRIAELQEQVKDYDPSMLQNFRLLQKHHNKTIEEMTRLKVQIDVLKKDQVQLHQALGRKGIH